MRQKAVRRLTNTSRHIKKTNKKVKKVDSSYQLPGEAGWDRNITQKENLEKLGAYSNINKRVSALTEKVREAKAKKDADGQSGSQLISVDEEVDLKDIKSILAKNKLPEETYTKQKPGRITIDEEWAIEKIVGKYKTSFDRAYLDHKTNSFMWTADQIAKKHTVYIEKHGQCPKQ